MMESLQAAIRHVALTIFEKFKTIEYLISKFIIPCSIFDICFSKFLFRSDWLSIARGRALMKLQHIQSHSDLG